jgi:hypothetical protein
LKALPDKYPFKYSNDESYWKSVTKGFLPNDLSLFIKIIAIGENNISGWKLGSVTPIIWLFYNLAFSDNMVLFPPQEIYIIRGMLNNFRNRPNSLTEITLEWLLKNTYNPYIPFGFKKIRTNSLMELEVRVNYLIQEKLRKSIQVEEEKKRAVKNLEIKEKKSEKDKLLKTTRDGIRNLLANKLYKLNGNDKLQLIINDGDFNLYDYKEELLKILDSKYENLNPILVKNLLKKFKVPEREKKDLNKIRKKFENLYNG